VRTMGLEDFEKELAESRRAEEEEKAWREHSEKDSKHKPTHRHHHRSRREGNEDKHRHKRRRQSDDEGDEEPRRERKARRDREGDSERRPRIEKEDAMNGTTTGEGETSALPEQALQRDSWMEVPPTDVEIIHARAAPEPRARRGSAKEDFEQKIHENELSRHHIIDSADEKGDEEAVLDEPAQHEVDYTFGDSGSQWRMTKLRAVYRQAEELKQKVEAVALKHYGDLRGFDDAREEEVELERRKTYGKDYVGNERPSGELFQQRKMDAGIRRESTQHDEEDQLQDPPLEIREIDEKPSASTAILDQTALNRLRAQMMKAKLKGVPNAATLEAEYNAASAAAERGSTSGDVVLGTMESRMLAGGRKGEVREITNRRGRERGHVEENEAMSIEDMVREERRTRGQLGGEGKRLAERIAKDGKFTDDLDYMDENASKLAKRVHQSDSKLRDAAIHSHRQTDAVLANCPLCQHEDRPGNPLPTAPIVSLAHRTYLTLPTQPEISPHGGAIIAPLTHHANLLHCDDDEWEEVRNFQKALTRLYHARNLGVIFYENAADAREQRHAALVAVALPLDVAATAPAFFREAILAADEEWAQHRKLIETRDGGRRGFRRALAKEMPYFHVWTEIDGGLGHVVDDDRRWPRGDLFAREVLAGMGGVGVEVAKRQGRWDRSAETQKRVAAFRKGWNRYDWTRVLVEGEGGQ